MRLQKRWMVFLAAIGSFCTLIVGTFFSNRLVMRLALPFRFMHSQFEANHPLLNRYGTFISSLGLLFVLGISGVLILYITPRRVRRVADTFSAKLGNLVRLTLLGFLIELLVLFVSIASALMVGTFPLTILFFGLSFVLGLVGLVSLAFAVGRGIFIKAQWENISPIYSFLLGLLILLALTPIPVVGGVFFFAFACLGLGAMVLSHFGSGDPWTLTPLLEK